jgi:hypothetical protein
MPEDDEDADLALPAPLPTHNQRANLPENAQKLVEALLRLGIDGVGPLKSARDSADEARRKTSTDDEAIRSLIRTHVALAGAQGFVTNLGGLPILPITLPANVGAAYLIQTHLAASVAHVKGHDLDDDDVRAAILLCLLGNSAVEVLKKTGIVIGEKFSMAMIKKLPMSVIYRINKRAGFALVAKFGTMRSAVTLSKAVPVVGGFIGGGVDAAATRGVGAFAKRFFTDTPPEPPLTVV